MILRLKLMCFFGIVLYSVLGFCMNVLGNLIRVYVIVLISCHILGHVCESYVDASVWIG